MEVRILCNERATARYKQYERLSLGWVGRRVIAESLRNIISDGRNKIVLDDQFPHEHTVDLVDDKTGVNFTVSVRCRRLGEDTGKTTLINLDEYLENIVSQMRDRTRKLTAGETEELVRLIGQPYGL